MQKGSRCRIKIAGEAGDGVISAGEILMRAAVRAGYYASVVKTFPSNIKGGYAHSLVTLAHAPVVSPVNDYDILVPLGADSFMFDTKYVSAGAVVLADTSIPETARCGDRCRELAAAGARVVALPLCTLAAGGVRATFALGILCKILSIDRTIACVTLQERYARKGPAIAGSNREAFDAGYAWAEAGLHDYNYQIAGECGHGSPQDPLIIDGNQALALGALHAGCAFFASYPITPATSIGETLARYMWQRGGQIFQAEDEIAALGAVTGASFSGLKAATATSGPGLSLMQEFIGYASMAEIPVVIFDVQRAGPSTGMPTKHSQDDLMAAAYGGHGEGPRIVIAPLDVEDCYRAAVDAFNCAERYQCPVLLLGDSAMGSARAVVEKKALAEVKTAFRLVPDEAAKRAGPFSRYQLSKSSVNPMPVPGVSAQTYCATGIEHDEEGATVNDPDMRSSQMERRFAKLVSVETDFDNPVVWDMEDGAALYDAAVCAWGFTAAAAREAVSILRGRRLRIAAVYPRLMFPVCKNAIAKWKKLSNRYIVVEANFTGQYATLLRAAAGIEADKLSVYRGEPFTPREIADGIVHLLGKDGI